MKGSSMISSDCGQHFDAIVLKAIGHNAHCPISPISIIICHETLTLDALPHALSLFADVSIKSTFVFFV
jgi:hypothetical protein